MSTLRRQNRPLIGVSPSCVGGRPTVSGLYLDAVWRAGGLGVMLPYTDEPARWEAYASLFDGFLFSGGVDIDPARYGEIALPCVEIDPALAGLDRLYVQDVVEKMIELHSDVISRLTEEEE